MIALLDYDSGNLRSVQKALLKVGADVRVCRQPAEMRGAAAVVLPGVGAFDDCLNSLRKQQLLGAVKEFIQTGKPFLGICVGYQALFEKSEEFNSCAAGLGVFAGKVVRFTERPGLKIPQIGWNPLEIGSHVYFVHSFYPQPVDQNIVATRTEHGDVFASSVWKDNVFATQFHPEKSQEVGLRLLKNFVELAS
jgi:glutamine amidotransferase